MTDPHPAGAHPDGAHPDDAHPDDAHPAGDAKAATPDAAAKLRRKRMTIGAVALVLGAICMWGASRMTWAKLQAYDHLQVKTFKANGGDWSPWLIAVPIVLVAALAAMVALKRWALRIAAILVAVLCVFAAIPAISMLTSGDDLVYASKAADVPGLFIVESMSTSKWPAVLVLIGAVLGVIGAMQMMRVAVGGTGLSSKYQTPAARRAELEREVFDKKKTKPAGGTKTDGNGAAEQSGKPAAPDTSDRLLWDALDSGEDPTEAGNSDTK